MSQFKRISSCGFMVSILGLLTGARLAAAEPQQQNSNWDNLKKLTSGEQVRVVQNDAKSYQGKFEKVTDEGIVVGVGGSEQTYTRQAVLRVSARKRGHRWRHAGIGAAVGAGAGLGIGVAVDASSKCSPTTSFCFEILPNGGKEIFTPLGGVIGAIVGAVVPSGGWRDVYRAR